jgi:hypothetical protein
LKFLEFFRQTIEEVNEPKIQNYQFLIPCPHFQDENNSSKQINAKRECFSYNKLSK